MKLISFFMSFYFQAQAQKKMFFGKVDIAVVYHRVLEMMIELNRQHALKEKAKGFRASSRGKQIFHFNDIAPCLVSYLEPFKRLNNSYLNSQKGLQ